MAYPTLEKPNRSRPALLTMIACVISTDNPRIRREDVNDNTRIVPTQIAIFEMQLRHHELLDEGERVPLASTVGEILDEIQL